MSIPKPSFNINTSIWRIIRLLFYSIGTTTILLLTINIIISWIFIDNLIYPNCPEQQYIPEIFIPEEHWIQTQDGISIRIWYYPPQNNRVIITFGGLTGSLGNQIPPIKALTREGYGIIQVDTRACATPPAPVTLGVHEVYDAEAALKFLQTQPGVETDAIGVMGFSLGGATAIQIMARHHDIKGLIRDGGYAEMGDLFSFSEKSHFILRFFQKTMGLLFEARTGVDPNTISPIDDLKLIRSRPVLLIYGESEVEPGLAQYQAGGNTVTLWIVPNGSHGRNHIAAPTEYQNRVLDFFNQALLGVEQD